MLKNHFPLHPSQLDVYLDQLISLESPKYNTGGYIKIIGKIDKHKILDASRSLPLIFDAFKMRFDYNEPNLIFGCLDEKYDHFEIKELSFCDQDDPENAAKIWVQDRFNLTFEIKKGSLLFEQFLLNIADNEHWLFVRFHHLINDGYGFSIWAQYIAKKYMSLLNKHDLEFKYPSYINEAIKASDYYKTDNYKLGSEYWKTRIGENLTISLKKNNHFANGLKNKSLFYTFDLHDHQRELLNRLVKKTNLSLPQLTIAALIIYLGKTSEHTDFLFGTSIHRRGSKHLKNILGMFTGVIPFKGKYTSDIILIDFLTDIAQAQKRDYRYHNYLLCDLKKDFKTILSDEDFVQIFVNYQLFDFKLNFGEAIQSIAINIFSEYDNAPLKFDWRDYGNQQPLQLHISFLQEYFNLKEIGLLTSRIFFILTQFEYLLNETIGNIQLLPPAERSELLEVFNETDSDYPREETVVGLFQAQAARTPNHIALVFEDTELTYRELNERANKLANYLRLLGVGTETLVPVCIERGIEMIVAILAIMKAGGAYVPIDPSYPQDRIAYMLQDSGGTLVVTSSSVAPLLPADERLQKIELDTDWPRISKKPGKNLASPAKPGNLAYVIYTSGSTGRPKGVMIEHAGLVNVVINYIRTFNIQETDRYLQFMSSVFDGSLLDIFTALLSGASLFLPAKEIIQQADLFLLYIQKCQISIFTVTPSYLSTLNKAIMPTVRILITAGEPCIIGEATYYSTFKGFYNGYGPTEATVATTLYKVGPVKKHDNIIPIGKPIANTRIYIVNPMNQLSPIGVPGEICIAGTGLARGYLNRPDLTAEKFVPNPFSTERGSRIYRTGDLGRWLPDGNIEYLGRRDDQVKIRGYRIELGEIESVLQGSPGVSQAVVLALDDNQGNKRLVGYVVPDGVFERSVILGYLGGKLPEYMVPSFLVELAEMPLTANGKIDRKSLPSPEAGAHLETEYKAPQTPLELDLAEIWQDLLGVERVGLNDNFFELGGHSLLAIRMVSAIRRKVEVEISIGDVFDYPTILSLAEQLTSHSVKDMLPPIGVQDRPDRIPLSFSQERLWFIDQMEGSLPYHVPTVLRLRGDLNELYLEQAIQDIVNRHEVLRTVIDQEEGIAYQRVLGPGEWVLGRIDGSSYKGNEDLLRSAILSLSGSPFDLSADYMLRCDLIRLAPQDNILVATLHHIASDGWSSPILVRELTALYNAKQAGISCSLPTLPVQYADYAIWQRGYLKDEFLEERLSYWRGKLSGLTPLDLPTDYVRPPLQSTRGANIQFQIDGELAARLQHLSQEQGATMFMIMLAAFKVLLYRYSGQQDICIGSPIANRPHQEIEGLIGFFVNTLALRSDLQDESSFVDLLQQVRETSLEAYDHQDVPFERVVEAVVKDRDMSRSPLFQVMFVLHNAMQVSGDGLTGIALQHEPSGYQTTKFDLTLSIQEQPDRLYGNIEYCSDLYKEDTIVRMGGHYVHLLESIVNNPDGLIGELELLPPAERSELLEVFNETDSDYPREETVVGLFQAQAARTPNHIALVFEDTELTYRELNERANKLANYLRLLGVGTETLVPVCIERGIEMIVAILAIMKAGGAYVPIDPSYPQDRIAYMLQDSGGTLVVTSSSVAPLLPADERLQKIELDTDWPRISKKPGKNLASPAKPGNLAYVIYTSGSTGRPKGVMIEHGSATSFIHWCYKEFDANLFNIVFFATSYCFDLSIFEIFYTLSIGKTLRILDSGIEMGFYLSKHQNILINTVPSIMDGLLKSNLDFSNITMLNIAGEPIPYYFKESLNHSRVQIRNLYGPTETTTYSSCYLFSDNEAIIPIGKPIANTRIYIVNPMNQLSPIGVPGEICIAGTGLARGYLNRPDLTAEKFVPNPFSTERGSRIYRTGDLGRWLPDGNIEYLGRRDDQVKIRGYRIELGEIESVLQGSPGVSQAVVLALDDNQGNKRLVGYVVPDGVFERSVILGYLGGKLPEYMVPSFLVELAEMPLTANGKIDRKSLPSPEAGAHLETEYKAPQTPLELDLAEIWQDLLGVERVGLNDDFFELGGHSLLAIRVISAINKQFNTQLTARDIFVHPTIGQVSVKLEEGNSKE